MIEEFVKALEEKERQAALSHEHMVICEEHLAEQITKGVDACPLDEYRSDMLMRALDTALGNLEIDKATFIKGWSRGMVKDVKDDIETAGAILEKFSKNGITTITGLAAGLSCILDKTFDRDLIKIVIKLMDRYYNE